MPLPSRSPRRWQRSESMDPVELLRHMVEIPSLSGQEGALAAFLAEAMGELGFRARVDEAGNAVGVREALAREGRTREIVLLGHMDTVRGDIPVRLEGGCLYGRGTVDAKGPLATFIVAAARAELAPGTRLVVVGAVEGQGEGAEDPVAAAVEGVKMKKKKFLSVLLVIKLLLRFNLFVLVPINFIKIIFNVLFVRPSFMEKNFIIKKVDFIVGIVILINFVIHVNPVKKKSPMVPLFMHLVNIIILIILFV